jgi:hypothetical protein
LADSDIRQNLVISLPERSGSLRATYDLGHRKASLCSRQAGWDAHFAPPLSSN